MKQQVVFIHGGESKDNYKDFSDYLNKLEYKPFEEKGKKWKNTLISNLGSDFEVFMPGMPNKDFANYNEWKVMFEKVFPFLKSDIILIGHSLGASFLCKYLEENSFPFELKKVFLVSGVFKDSGGEVLGNFNFTINNLKRYERQLSFYHSTDDFIVPFSDLENFKKILRNSEYKIFKDKGHFIDETFPEIIEDIKKLVK